MIRISLNMSLRYLAPFPSSPMRLVAGTWQSSKMSSIVAAPRADIFSIFCPIEKPGVPFSTRKKPIPPSLFPGSVVAATVTKSATSPSVIHSLRPVSIYPRSFFTARVLIPPRSDPQSGSVSAIVPILSPFIAGIRYFLLCSSLPNLNMKSVPMRHCIVTMAANPIETRASSSASMVKDTQSASMPPISDG